MADAMQGVMSLAPKSMGQRTPPRSFLTPEDETTLAQLRSAVSPQEFSKEMFNAAEQADPQAVARLRNTLRNVQLPEVVVDLLKEMVDILLQDPAKYKEYRKKLIEEGVPENLLPTEFDPMFLTALNMALDQISVPAVQGFAKGGLVKNPISAGIASLGRNGDRILAHITPREAKMLRRAGGAATINPVTGLPEFFSIGGVFEAVGDVFKGATKAVTGAVESVAGFVGDAVSTVVDTAKDFVKTPVGQIVTSVAIGFVLGPAAASMLGVSSAAGVAAISGFLGSAGASLLAGNSFKNALKAGAVGGVTAGAVAGISGGAEAFKTGSYTGPTTVSESFQKATEAFTGKPTIDATKGISSEVLDDTAAMVPEQVGALNKVASVADETVAAADEALGSGYPRPVNVARTEAVPMDIGIETRPLTGGNASDVLRGAQSPVIEGTGPVSLADYGRGGIKYVGDDAAATFRSGLAGEVRPDAAIRGSTGFSADAAMLGGRAGPIPDAAANLPGNLTGPATPYPVKDYLTGSLDEIAPITKPLNYQLPPQKTYGEMLSGGQYKEAASKAFDDTLNYFSPSAREAVGNQEALNVYKNALAETGSEELAAKMAEKAMPGFLSIYGPMIGLGVTAAYLGGAFTPQQPPKPDIPVSGTELYKKDPYLLLPRVTTYSPSTGGTYGGVTSYSASTGQPYSYAAGGVASLVRDTSRFPRKTGPIDGPGTGTSDSIPAMLSDGEFVFTAKAVRAMGKGSRRKGAKRMYALMKALEKRA